jgi:hypothetical protein
VCLILDTIVTYEVWRRCTIRSIVGISGLVRTEEYHERNRQHCAVASFDYLLR